MAPTELPRVGGYQLLRIVGRGGMGEVWEALAPGTGERVALKLLSRTEAHVEPTSDVTFLDEARLGARLVHKNLVRVTDVGVDGATLYFAMELLEGRPVSSLTARGVIRLPVPLVVELCRQALAGLSAVHHHLGPDGQEAHIVHRDLKPSNLFLTDSGVLKVIDFGIARGLNTERTRTRTGVFRGSLPYASPEQARGQPVDERSDLFSFAAVVFELLTGRRLFNYDNDAAIVLAIVNQPAPPVTSLRADVPDALATWLSLGLERDIDRRPSSAKEWLLELEEAAAGLPRWSEADVALWLKTVPLQAPTLGTAELEELPVAPLLSEDEPASTAVEIERPSARRGQWAAALLVSLAIAAGGVWYVTRDVASVSVPVSAPISVVTAPPNPVPTPTPAPIPDEPVAVVAPVPAPAPQEVPKKVVKTSGRAGWVTVDVSPGYGKVRIDGNALGLTPLYRATLSPGRHTIEVENEDGRVKRRVVQVASEREAVVRFSW